MHITKILLRILYLTIICIFGGFLLAYVIVRDNIQE